MTNQQIQLKSNGIILVVGEHLQFDGVVIAHSARLKESEEEEMKVNDLLAC